MSKFAIYNYNFLRIIEPNVEHQLEFPDWENVNVKESLKIASNCLKSFCWLITINHFSLRMPERNFTGTNR